MANEENMFGKMRGRFDVMMAGRVALEERYAADDKKTV